MEHKESHSFSEGQVFIKDPRKVVKPGSNGLPERHTFLQPSLDRDSELESKGCLSRCNLLQVLQTVASYGCYCGLGLIVSIMSSSLIDLESRTRSTSDEIAMLWTWQNLGRLPAVLLAGFTIDRFNKEVQLGLAVLILAVCGTSYPFWTSYVVLSVMVGIVGSCIGFLGGGCTHYIMSVWEKPSAILGLHLALSIGSTIGPFLAEPFLSHNFVPELNSTGIFIPQNNTNGSEISDFAPINTYSLISPQENYTAVPSHHRLIIQASSNSSDLTLPLSSTAANQRLSYSGMGYLHYPYIVMGAFNIAVALLFFMLFCVQIFKKSTSFVREDSKAEEAEKDAISVLSQQRKILLLISYSLYFFFNGGVEVTYGGLVVMYAYKTLSMSKNASTVVNAAFWGSLSSGRILGILISHFGFLRVNIGLCIGLGILSMAALSFLGSSHFMVIWICSVLLGLAMACTVGNMLTLAKQDLKSTGSITSFFMFSLYLGMMLVPAATGTMFKTFGVFVFPYICLSCLCLMGVAFGATVLLGKRSISR